MSDKLVFDLAQEVEGSPNVFIRKDWLNILDNQNQNYNNNQSIIDTSQLSNSNKYMSYREAYFLIPLLLSIEGTYGAGTVGTTPFKPATRPSDYTIGLKNWFGQIIHSFTLDYNGTTIIQQTPYVNMWNAFKLMTSLSYDDICTQGATIGFYPDDPTSWTWTATPAVATAGAATGQFILQDTNDINPNAGAGQGVANNSNALQSIIAKNISSQFNQFNSGAGNRGFCKRQTYINFDVTIDGSAPLPYDGAKYPTAYSDFISGSNCEQLWKSYITKKVDGTDTTKGILQISVMATVYLKHIHSFFNMCPLLKGVFMKMTMNLNNSTTTFVAGYGGSIKTVGAPTGSGQSSCPFLAATGVSCPIGGINVGMISSVAPASAFTVSSITDNTASLVAVPVVGNTFSMGSATEIDITAGTISAPTGTINVTGSAGQFASSAVPPVQVATATLGTGGGSSGITATLGGTGIQGTAGQIVGGATVGISLPSCAITLSAASATAQVANGGSSLLPSVVEANAFNTFRFNISVGSRCLDTQITTASEGKGSKSIYLYIPAYTFNPVFEQAYLSSPVKQIKYTDIYQYQVLAVGANSQFNNLLTNGIANIKSVLILPYLSGASSLAAGISGKYTTNAATSVTLSPNSGFLSGIPIWQSPFDVAGSGATSPLCLFKNFNIQISGQNAIYNLEKYAFEQFNNQLYGQNAVNGGLTDGLTSGLIDRLAFDMEYCYYYVNVERMLPVEMSVPKSVQILGTSASERTVDLYCFVEYGVEISIDALTGARV
jgi:hypothetical protein